MKLRPHQLQKAAPCNQKPVVSQEMVHFFCHCYTSSDVPLVTITLQAIINILTFDIMCRLLDLVSSHESAMSSVWQPVVLPAADSQQRRDVLAGFSTGKTNMLIAVAGSGQCGQIPPCSLAVR